MNKNNKERFTKPGETNIFTTKPVFTPTFTTVPLPLFLSTTSITRPFKLSDKQIEKKQNIVCVCCDKIIGKIKTKENKPQIGQCKDCYSKCFHNK